MTTALIIIAILILLNGIFVAAEFAIIGAPRTVIEARAAGGERQARLVRQILADPRRQDRYIATAQLGITVASLGLGMYGEHMVADWIHERLNAAGAPGWLGSGALASVAAIAVLTYFHIVLGEMVPKSLALQYAERSVLWLSPLMVTITRVFYPLVLGINGVANGVLRLTGISRHRQTADQYYTAEELALIVEESEARGALQGESGQMLRELFEFGDLTAGEVMVPRVRLVGLETGASLEDIREIIAASPHTRYPVYEGDFDHILGAIHIKELLRLLLDRRPLDASRVRPLPIVPETAHLDVVLTTMRTERTQVALVIDEHGGTAGVVTLEDLFEEVVGEIDERGGSRAAPVHEGPDGRLRVPGTLRLDELGEELGLELQHEEVDSVGGLVLTLLGRPAVVGDTVRYERIGFEVTAVKGHAVEECAVDLSA